MVSERLKSGILVLVTAFLTACFVAYAFELFYVTSLRSVMREAAAKNAVRFDGRRPFQVVREMRDRGEKAYPALWGLNQTVPVIHINDAEVVPLAGISRSITVFCNESGQYLVYRSDEHGFHNPSGIWNSQHFDVAVVGDSFAQGYCVPLDQDLVASIRWQFPSTISVGVAGNGPLKEL